MEKPQWWIGLIGILSLAVFLYAVSRPYDEEGEYTYNKKPLLIILCVLWLLFSTMFKTTLVIGYYTPTLAKLAFAFFLALLVAVVFFVKSKKSYVRHASYEILSLTTLITSMAIDILLGFF